MLTAPTTEGNNPTLANGEAVEQIEDASNQSSAAVSAEYAKKMAKAAKFAFLTKKLSDQPAKVNSATSKLAYRSTMYGFFINKANSNLTCCVDESAKSIAKFKQLYPHYYKKNVRASERAANLRSA